MVDAIADALESFGGEVNHTRCFAHTVNLVAKTVLHQFEVEPGRATDALDEAEQALRELAQSLELEELETVAEKTMEGELEEVDDMTGWIDEQMLLSKDEKAALKKDVLPVKQVLVKVRQYMHTQTQTHQIPAPQDCLRCHSLLDHPSPCLAYSS